MTEAWGPLPALLHLSSNSDSALSLPVSSLTPSHYSRGLPRRKPLLQGGTLRKKSGLLLGKASEAF